MLIYVGYVVPVQTGSETVLGNMGIPRPETKRSSVFGKIPDLDLDCWVWSSPDRVPIGLGPNFPNTRPYCACPQTSWMLARRYPSHPDHAPCMTSPCRVYLLQPWPPLVWGTLMCPTPLPSLLAPPLSRMARRSGWGGQHLVESIATNK